MAVVGDLDYWRGWLARKVGADATDPDWQALADDCLQEALEKVNSFWPLTVVSSFETVAGSQSYQPMPAGGRRLRKVFWTDEINVGADIFPEDVRNSLYDGQLMVSGGVDEQGHQSPVYAFDIRSLQRHQSYLLDTFGRATFVQDFNTAWLVPCPTQVQTVYYIYETVRYSSAAEMEDNIPEALGLFRLYAQMMAMDAMTSGPGAIYEVKAPDGQTVKIDIKAIQARRDTLADQYYDLIPPPGLSSWWDALL